jgi:hypothetical protein
MIEALYRGAGLSRHQSLQPVEEIEGVARGQFVEERFANGGFGVGPCSSAVSGGPGLAQRAEIELGAAHRSLS